MSVLLHRVGVEQEMHRRIGHGDDLEYRCCGSGVQNAVVARFARARR